MEDALKYYKGFVFSFFFLFFSTADVSFNLKPCLFLIFTNLIDVHNGASVLLREACEALEPKGSSAGVFNSLPWDRHEVIQIKDSADQPSLGV